MAERGGQPGNQNAAKAKRWEAALERAFAAYPDEPDMTDCTPFMIGLNKAAANFVKRTMEVDADLGFFRETGDRFDGKAAQSLTIGGDPDKPLHVFAREMSDDDLARIAKGD